MHVAGVLIGSWILVNAALAVALLTARPETEPAGRDGHSYLRETP
jgi:hypothetical protein